MRFFEPKLRCFVLPNVDVTPTMEEYHSLLRPNWCQDDARMYIPDLTKPMPKPTALKHFLERHFGIHPTWSKFGVGNQRGSTVLKWNQIYSSMKENRGKIGSSTHRAMFLALGIYGLVLFPSHRNMIDYRVLDLLMKVVDDPDINIMLTVLAETLQTCEYIKRKKEGDVRFCAEVFTMWIHEHFSRQGGPSYKGANMFTDKLPMKDFGAFPKVELPMEEWYRIFYDATSDKMTWRVKWMSRVYEYMTPPKEQNWIPLVGIFGAISYTPNMVARQFGDEQAVPSFGGVDAWCFEYNRNPNTAIKLQDMMKRWGECRMHPIKKTGGAQNSYLRWRENWVQTKTIPRNVKPTLHSKLRDAMKLIGQLTQERYQILEELANCRRDNALEMWWEDMRDNYLVELKDKVQELQEKNRDLTRRTEQAEEKVRCKVPRQCSLKIQKMKAKMEDDMDMLKATNERLNKLVDGLHRELGRARAEIGKLRSKVEHLEEELARTKESCRARAANEVKEARDEMRRENLTEVEALMAFLDSSQEERDHWKEAFEKSEKDKEAEIAIRVAEEVENVRRDLEAAASLAAQQKDEKHEAEVGKLHSLLDKNNRRVSEALGIAAKNEWLYVEAAKMAYWIKDATDKQLKKGRPTNEELRALYEDVVGFTRQFTDVVDSRIFLSED